MIAHGCMIVEGHGGCPSPPGRGRRRGGRYFMSAATALEYAGWGWAVFPLFGAAGGRCRCSRPACDRPSKHPLVRQGVHEASTDPATIAAWWRLWP